MAQVAFGFMITVGVATEVSAALTACMSFGMAIIALRPSGWFWNRHGMGYAAFWGLAAASLMLTVPGKWSIERLLD